MPIKSTLPTSKQLNGITQDTLEIENSKNQISLTTKKLSKKWSTDHPLLSHKQQTIATSLNIIAFQCIYVHKIATTTAT